MKKISAPYFVERVGGLVAPRRMAESYLDANDYKLPRVIYPELRVITADKATHNKTFYPEASLRGDPEQGTGLISFTRPYGVPIIRDHNMGGGLFGGEASDVYGRVFHPAQFHRMGNEGFVRAMPTISHPEAVEAVLTGRWLTVSLGSRTESVHCSICKTNLTEEECEHQRGSWYDTEEGRKEALLVIGPIRAKEISFVLEPSDNQAGVLTPNVKESASFPNSVSRILVGDERGVFDLATGARIAESERFERVVPRKFRLGFSSSSLTLKESRMPEKPKTDESQAQELYYGDGTGFKGEGRYILHYYDHDHDVVLDGKGDGVSSANFSPGEEEAHTHEVVGGIVRFSGQFPHTHSLSVAHAAAEAAPSRPAASEAVDEAQDADDDTPLTLGQLYGLPEDDPDYNTPDNATDEAEAREARLTAAQRKKLPSSAFCGPGRSFPAHDKAHVRAGLSLLGRSKYSASTKARIRACLRRKGRALGMDISDEMTTYAAVLVDQQHQVETPLYALPATAEALNTLLGQIEKMPHTPKEKAAILSRVAAHCRSFLDAAEWQSHFGELTECEAGDPVQIPITAENYGLLYTVRELAEETPDAESVDEDPTPETKEEAPEKITQLQPTHESQIPSILQLLNEVRSEIQSLKAEKADVKETVEKVADALKDDAAKTEEKVEEPKAEEKTDEKATEPQKVEVELDTVQAQLLTRREGQLKSALAHAVALYMQCLRKPQARGRSQSELVKFLSSRTIESLYDALADYQSEWDAAGKPQAPRYPVLENPTEVSDEGPNPGRKASAEETAKLDAAPAEEPVPPGRISAVEELSDDEEEIIQVRTALLSEMFSGLRLPDGQ